MATGYTASIAKNISFPQFALQCSRAFGALVELRDDPLDTAVPDRIEPSTYHQEQLTKTEKELEAARNWTVEQIAAKALKAEKYAISRYKKNKQADRKLNDQYDEMLWHVQRWQPPTTEHQGLKDFMLKQIQESIEWDCRNSQAPNASDFAPATWYKTHLEALEDSVAYHTKGWHKEQTSAAEKTKWIQDLKASL